MIAASIPARLRRGICTVLLIPVTPSRQQMDEVGQPMTRTDCGGQSPKPFVVRRLVQRQIANELAGLPFMAKV